MFTKRRLVTLVMVSESLMLDGHLKKQGKGIMLREVSQIEKDKYSLISLICGL